MKKSIKFITLILTIGLVALPFFGIFSDAAAYTTYTYSINGKPLDSPDASSPWRCCCSQQARAPRAMTR